MATSATNIVLRGDGVKGANMSASVPGLPFVTRSVANASVPQVFVVGIVGEAVPGADMESTATRSANVKTVGLATQSVGSASVVMVTMAPPVPFHVQLALLDSTAMRLVSVSTEVNAVGSGSAGALQGIRDRTVKLHALTTPGASAVPSTVAATMMPSAIQRRGSASVG